MLLQFHLRCRNVCWHTVEVSLAACTKLGITSGVALHALACFLSKSPEFFALVQASLVHVYPSSVRPRAPYLLLKCFSSQTKSFYAQKIILTLFYFSFLQIKNFIFLRKSNHILFNFYSPPLVLLSLSFFSLNPRSIVFSSKFLLADEEKNVFNIR